MVFDEGHNHTIFFASRETDVLGPIAVYQPEAFNFIAMNELKESWREATKDDPIPVPHEDLTKDLKRLEGGSPRERFFERLHGMGKNGRSNDEIELAISLETSDLIGAFGSLDPGQTTLVFRAKPHTVTGKAVNSSVRTNGDLFEISITTDMARAMGHILTAAGQTTAGPTQSKLHGIFLNEEAMKDFDPQDREEEKQIRDAEQSEEAKELQQLRLKLQNQDKQMREIKELLQNKQKQTDPKERPEEQKQKKPVAAKPWEKIIKDEINKLSPPGTPLNDGLRECEECYRGTEYDIKGSAVEIFATLGFMLYNRIQDVGYGWYSDIETETIWKHFNQLRTALLGTNVIVRMTSNAVWVVPERELAVLKQNPTQEEIRHFVAMTLLRRRAKNIQRQLNERQEKTTIPRLPEASKTEDIGKDQPKAQAEHSEGETQKNSQTSDSDGFIEGAVSSDASLSTPSSESSSGPTLELLDSAGMQVEMA